MVKIKSITAQIILDSRKNPTIEVIAETSDFSVKAGVPSGASTGKLEAKVIDVPKAIKNVNEIIAPQLIGKDPTNQKEIDNLMLEIDGTADKSVLGGNAIVGVSMAISKLGAQTKNIPLYKHISQCLEVEPLNIENFKMPLACFNIINGGAHANNDLDIQEFMIVPQMNSFSENFQSAKDIYQSLKGILSRKFDKLPIGDEGGFAPMIPSTIEALDFLQEAVVKAGFNKKEVGFLLDCAATHFQDGENYQLEGLPFSRSALLEFYNNLIVKYPIIGFEDPFAEDDWQGFQGIYNKMGSKMTIIGDDLLVTNPLRIQEAIEKTACNGVIIKVNQIGTVSEAIEAIKLAKAHQWKIMVSHRSGETMDDFIADFAIGVGADFIKSGAPVMPERLAKYNRLLLIEEKENEK
ncbi:enolase [Patescibacteria group bacterium]|nr:enolase [Patescibacteria group bacterium]MBU4162145.1 enolase [Patescibacteria group bacterium]